MFYRLLKFALLGPLLKLLFGPDVEGAEFVPAEGPAIIASNHLSFADHFLMPLKLPRTVFSLAKLEYFTGKGIKGRATAAFFRNVGSVPVDRTGGNAADPAMETSLRLLGEGKLFCLYPEGTRSPDGRLYKGRTGVARLALKSGVPVVPCAMIGTDEVLPTGKMRPKVRKVEVKFGRPLDFSRYEGMENDRFILRSVTDEIMYEIMKLSGQEYVDMYATKAKEELARARRERVTQRIKAVTPGRPGGEEKAQDKSGDATDGD